MNTTLEVNDEIKTNLIQKVGPKLNWRREHLALAGILLLSAFLGLWNLTINGYSNEFYAAPVRSMLQSWHNFFYLAFDPGGFITVDKPPLAFMIQTVFAFVFGYNGVSLLLPEALAGVGGVFVLYLTVKRAFGTGAGLLAALILAVMPIFVVMNRNNNPDSLLLFALILSAYALLRAAEAGKLGWLLLSGLLVGLAFNVKMLEAWIVLPALYGTYFLFARTGWIKKIGQLALVSLVIAVVSFSWAVAVDLTPAQDRPFIDGTSRNSVIDLIFGYNGLGRVDGNERGTTTGGSGTTDGRAANGSNPVAPPNGTTANGQPGVPGGNFQPPNGQGGPGGGGSPGFGGQPGPTRLITTEIAGEFNWFFPLALLGMVYLMADAWFGMEKGLARSRRLQTVALWGGWFIVFWAVLSFSKGIIHNYYTNVLTPAEAALAGIAIVTLWKRHQQGSWHFWLLPVGLAATAFYQAYLLTGLTSWNWWLSPVLIVVGVCALVGLALGQIWRNQRFSRQFVGGTVGVAVAVLLITPTLLSVRAVFTQIGGSMPSGVPAGNGGRGGFGGQSTNLVIPQSWFDFVGNGLGVQLALLAVIVAVGLILAGLKFGFKPTFGKRFSLPMLSSLLLFLFLVGSTGFWVNAAQAKTTSAQTDSNNFGPGGQGVSVNQSLITYLEQNQNGYKYLLAVSGSMQASPIIIETGQPVMSLGGFNGQAQTITTTDQLKQLIANHTVRYFMLGGGGGPGGGNSLVSQYVQQNCQVVNSSQYASSTGTGSQATGNTDDGTRRGGGFGGQQGLYVCGG